MKKTFYRSETSRCRSRLAPWCHGCGADVGFGGDPIKRDAITVDLRRAYARTGIRPQHLSIAPGMLPLLSPFFRDGGLDYVFSSHLIEDFTYRKQRDIIEDWSRVVRSGGRIVLYQPDQQRFEAHCKRTGQGLNLAHKERDYSLDAFKANVLSALSYQFHRILHEAPHVEDYSWEIVLEKL